MAYRVEVSVRVGFVPDGVGGAMIGGAQANIPGTGSPSTSGFGTVFGAQVRKYIQAEGVPGTLNAPSAANIATAINSAATDIQNQITAAELAIIQGWSTGSP